MPLLCLGELVVQGTAGISTPALHALLDAGVPLVLLRSDGRARGRLEPPGSPHVLLRQLQTLRCADPRMRLDVARACVTGKIANQRVLLVTRARRAPHRDELTALAGDLRLLRDRADAARCLDELVGIEGAASGAYFRGLRLVLDTGAGFRRRDRRGPDVVNALLNYGSALLRETVLAATVAAGLDPHASFLHQPARGRPTLAFDLMEEWRPVLLDTTVLAVLGLRSVTAGDCVSTPQGPRLSAEARAAFIARFRRRLAEPAQSWPPPSGRPDYAECVRRQARRLRAVIRGDAETYEAFPWR